MLADVLPYLVCPHCGADLALAGRAVRCASGHGFDVARQGYVSLLSGRAPVSGDSADMVAARADFLAAGHYGPIARAIVAAAGLSGAALDDATGAVRAVAHGTARLAGGAGAAADRLADATSGAGAVSGEPAAALGKATVGTSGAVSGAAAGDAADVAGDDAARHASGATTGDEAVAAADGAVGAAPGETAAVAATAGADTSAVIGAAGGGTAAGPAAGGATGGEAAGVAATAGADTSAVIGAAAGDMAAAVAAAGGTATGPAAGCVADLGAGTGHYLAAVLDAAPERVGLALEISKPALRRAARAHSRLGAVGCDVWGRLPVRTGAISVALNVFAPRNPAELDRVLAPDGVLVVVSPTTDHLAGLVADLGLLTVAPDKARRVAEQLAPLVPSTQDTVEFELALSHAEVLSLVGMGPSAWHIGGEALGERVAALPEPVRTTASVVVTAFRRA